VSNQDKTWVSAEISDRPDLEAAWDEHLEHYETKSAALRDVLDAQLLDSTTDHQQRIAVNRGLMAGLATLIIILLGQTWLTYSPAAALKLLAIALIVFGIVLAAPLGGGNSE
jgi:hypothetical protein